MVSGTNGLRYQWSTQAPVDLAHDLFGPDDLAQPVSQFSLASWSVWPTLGRFGPPPWRATSYSRGVTTITRHRARPTKIWWQRRRGRNFLNENKWSVWFTSICQFHLWNQHAWGLHLWGSCLLRLAGRPKVWECQNKGKWARRFLKVYIILQIVDNQDI